MIQQRILTMMTALITLAAGCGNQQNAPENSAEGTASGVPAIDRRSYNLGGIGAFSEMVGGGVKKLALSAPVTPEEADALMEEAERIATNNKAEIFRETDFLVTDLFPADITEGKHVLLIYKGTTRQEYMDLKAEKQRLIDAGEYTGQAREDIARKMGALLSYPEEKINQLLSESTNRQTQDTPAVAP